MVIRILLSALMLLSTAGCELLNVAASRLEQPGLNYLMPEVRLSQSVLVSSPSGQDIAAYYCDDLVPFPANVGCNLLGPRPSARDMQFHFELQYLVDNPNPDIPIPTTEILAAIELFDGADTSELGAVCVALCNEGDEACTGAPGANGCVSEDSDITGIGDLQDRLLGLLFLTVDEAINGDLDNLAQRLIPAGAKNFDVRVRFSLGAEAMLDILSTVVNRLLSEPADLLVGGLQIDIPYSVRGSLWFDIPVLGRVALGYGPLQDSWIIEIPTF